MDFKHLTTDELNALLSAQGIDPAYKARVHDELTRRSERKLEGGTDVNVRVPAGRSERTATSRGRMNKTEAAFAQELEALKRAGEIREWHYEKVKFRLADNTYYTPDFCIIGTDGRLSFVEVKGFLRDDAAVKWKVAAEQFPWADWTMVRRRKGGGWENVYERRAA